MKWFAIGLMYLGFFGLLGFAIFATQSAVPLWALLFLPSVDNGCCKCKGEGDEEAA